MTHHDAFLRDIIEHPDEDAPRLIYADWLDEHGQPDRAEFIRVQCALARRFGVSADGSPVVTGDKEADAEEVALRRRSKWLAGRCPAPSAVHTICDGWDWCRGFVESVTCTAATWLENADALCAAAPLTRVRLTTWPGALANPQTGWALYDGIRHDTCRQRRHLPGLPANGLRAREAVALLLRAEWPGIDFELSPGEMLDIAEVHRRLQTAALTSDP